MGSSTEVKQSPNGLLAVLLVTRSRPGPKLVFHYPALPQVFASGHKSGESREEEESDFDSDAEDGEPNAGKRGGGSRTAAAKPRGPDHLALGASMDHYPDKSVLGYSIDSLEKLLSPGRWSDRKKFEVCLDGITFVGHPIYAGEDGLWSKGGTEGIDHADAAGSEHSPASNTKERAEREAEGLGATAGSPNAANITITAPEIPAQGVHDFTHVPDSFDSQLGSSLATSMASTSAASGAVTEQLGMFNVVFAVSGGQQEAAEVYQHVARKLSKALHYCQKQTNYVATESRKLLGLKARAKQNKTSADALWTQMIESSELAWALKELHQKLTTGEVAGLRLSGIELSLQLSQASAFQERDVHDQAAIGVHSGLLLLEDKDVLLRELQHPDASPLAYFIREHTPTKSLQKLAGKLNLRNNDVVYLSQHLVKWRKARIIPILHPRNMYVVQTDAPIEKVPALTQVYGRRFAALPPLPQMLKVLSGRPIRYGVLIPSKDHRAPYMDVLAFMHRHGFVAQLKTFGWLRASPGAAQKTERAQVRSGSRPVSGVSLLSPHLRPSDDDAISVSSAQTAVTVQTAVPTKEESAVQEPTNSILIVEPADPVGDEVFALEHIEASIVDEELSEVFHRLLPYFDGEHALEQVAAKEGWKRAKVEEWLDWLEKEGFLTTFRALDAGGPHERPIHLD